MMRSLEREMKKIKEKKSDYNQERARLKTFPSSLFSLSSILDDNRKRGGR